MSVVDQLYADYGKALREKRTVSRKNSQKGNEYLKAEFPVYRGQLNAAVERTRLKTGVLSMILLLSSLGCSKDSSELDADFPRILWC